MLFALPNAVERLLPQSRVILVPQLQGTSHYPRHQGLDRQDLESAPEYTTELKHGRLDFSPLTPDWNQKRGIYATDDSAIRARAEWVRDFIRDREEETIVIVSHGSIMRCIAARDGRWSRVDVGAYWTCEIRLLMGLSGRAGIMSRRGGTGSSGPMGRSQACERIMTIDAQPPRV
jgi:hypothetical protein